jgi:hypothetical protein
MGIPNPQANEGGSEVKRVYYEHKHEPLDKINALGVTVEAYCTDADNEPGSMPGIIHIERGHYGYDGMIIHDGDEWRMIHHKEGCFYLSESDVIRAAIDAIDDEYSKFPTCIPASFTERE